MVKYYGQVISTKIGILTINSFQNLNSISKILNNNFPNKKFHVICGIWWSLESLKQILKMIIIVFTNKVKYKNVKFYFLCNTKSELKIINSLGLNGIFCNQNCFLDENKFRIINSPKKFDAIYNAVLLKFKRHYLMSKIRNGAIITYNFENSKYKVELDKILDDSINWLNYKCKSTPRFLSEYNLVEFINMSYVGLALSKEEGAMYASGEYLLCGIPIVSTKSKGGRDVFFTRNNSMVVNNTSESVFEAVKQLKNKNIDPSLIRNEFIDSIKEHRDNFNELLFKIASEHSCELEFQEDLKWNNWFINKLRFELSEDYLISVFK